MQISVAECSCIQARNCVLPVYRAFIQDYSEDKRLDANRPRKDHFLQRGRTIYALTMRWALYRRLSRCDETDASAITLSTSFRI